MCTHYLDKKPGAGRMGGRDFAGFEATPRYKHYKNAITNAVHLQMFRCYLTSVLILFTHAFKDMHCQNKN